MKKRDIPLCAVCDKKCYRKRGLRYPTPTREDFEIPTCTVSHAYAYNRMYSKAIIDALWANA